MKTCRKWVAALFAIILTVSSCVVMAEEALPTQWDLTEIYENVDAWQADYDRAMEILPQYESYQGTLNTAQGIYDYLQFAYMGELTRLETRLYLYAYLGYTLNPADSTFSALLAKITALQSEEARYAAVLQSELYSLPLETRQEFFADPLLEPFTYAFRSIVDPEYEPLSEETNTVLAILSPAMGRAENVFNILDSIEVPDPMITMPDGTEVALTDELYNQIIYSDEYDRDFKALCNQTKLEKQVPFVNTFAALLEMTVAENWAYAQIGNYDSSREAALDASDVDPEVYDLMIEAAHEGAADYQRYLNTHKRGLKLEKQYPFDIAAYVSDYTVEETSYEDAVEEVREALSVLGEEYISYYDRIINSGHVDVYPTDTKLTGAFSFSMGKEFLPFVQFNYLGYSSDVSTIAHELGHAIYSSYSKDNQESIYAEPIIFTQEVASTTNELLYYSYMMEHAATGDERMFYLENMLSMFSGTFFLQALYAEFEDAMYQTVESGGALDAEALSDLWSELYQEYRGDTIESFPDSRYGWASIPHFYYNYYVYQYATSVAYAASICERITNGEERAVEDYLAFLKLGASGSPEELLAIAGVDPLDEETYQRALDFFSEMVDEYERLVDAKLEQE